MSHTPSFQGVVATSPSFLGAFWAGGGVLAWEREAFGAHTARLEDLTVVMEAESGGVHGRECGISDICASCEVAEVEKGRHSTDDVGRDDARYCR